MANILKKEVLSYFKIEQKKVVTIAEVDNNAAKRLIYYLSFLNGSREDKRVRINKAQYEQEKAMAIKVEAI